MKSEVNKEIWRERALYIHENKERNVKEIPSSFFKLLLKFHKSHKNQCERLLNSLVAISYLESKNGKLMSPQNIWSPDVEDFVSSSKEIVKLPNHCDSC